MGKPVHYHGDEEFESKYARKQRNSRVHDAGGLYGRAKRNTGVENTGDREFAPRHNNDDRPKKEYTPKPLMRDDVTSENDLPEGWRLVYITSEDRNPVSIYHLTYGQKTWVIKPEQIEDAIIWLQDNGNLDGFVQK